MKKLLKNVKFMIAFLFFMIMTIGYFQDVSHASSVTSLQLKVNGDGTLTAQWPSVKDVEYYTYTIYTPTKTIHTVNRISNTTTQYTLSAGLIFEPTKDILYRVHVTGVDKNGKTLYGESRDITVPAGIASPVGLTNIVATSTTNSVTLTWDLLFISASGIPTGYEVLVNGIVYHTTNRSITISGLSHNTTYNFQIRSVKSVYHPVYTYTTYSAYSTRSIMTKNDPNAPVVPTNVNATATSNSVTVTWSAVSGASSYDVLLNGTVYNVTGTSRTITGLSPSTNYSYQVLAKNNSGKSGYSSARTITTLISPPTVPTNVNATSTNNSATVSWTAVSGATSYDILFNGSVYNTTSTSWTVTGLSQNTNYNYQVLAKNIGGSSSYSTASTIKTLPDPLTTPTNITETIAQTSVIISWIAVSGATSYDILFNGLVYNTTSTSRTFNSLTANTNYSYQVLAKNSNTSSPYSTAKTITTLSNPPSSAPSNVTATSTTNSVTISWTEVSGATSYDILFGGTVYNITGTSHTFTGLTGSTNYTYQVLAKNNGGSSTYSSSRTITTPPVTPTNVNATAAINSITVSWTAVSGASSYDILFNGTVYNTTSTSRTFSGLTANTNHTYQVLAKNSGGSSAYSAAKTITTLPNPPSSPTNVTATATNNSITISWTAVSGAASYDITFNGTTYNVTGTSRTFTGLLPNTSYSYLVQAVNSGGSSSYSSFRITATLPNPPTTPTNVTAKATNNSVTVSWTAVTGAGSASSYDILFNGTVYNVTGTSHTFNNLSPNTNYSYQVRAKNLSGTSAYSTSMTIRTLPDPPVTTPNITATATTNSVTLSWTAVSGATSYDILFNGVLYSVSGTSHTFTGLSPDTSHDYQVRATNGGGSSAYSSVKTITTLPNPPSSPINVTAKATTNSVTLSWTTVNGATSYEVLFDGVVYTVTGTSRTFTGLSPDTNYSYQVRAVNEGGKSAYSSLNSITTLPYNTPGGGGDEDGTPGGGEDGNPGGGEDGNPGGGEDGNPGGGEDGNPGGGEDGNPGGGDEDGNPGGGDEDGNPGGGEDGNPGGGEDGNPGGGDEDGNPGGGDEDGNPGDDNEDEDKSQRSTSPGKKANQSYSDGREQYSVLYTVNALSGAFQVDYTGLDDYGKDNLDFNLLYKSTRPRSDQGIGHKWTYSLNYRLEITENNAYFKTPYDDKIAFLNESSNIWQPSDEIAADYEMGRKADNSYFVKEFDGTEYIFDENLKLKKIIENGLETYTFKADYDGHINEIRGRYGRKLALEYTDNRISKVIDDMGNSLTITYMGENLTDITNSQGDTLSFRYDAANNIRFLKDFTGANYLTNNYDSHGRIINQVPEGRGKTTASYDDAKRINTFTDELGNETKYSYDEDFFITSVESSGSIIRNEHNKKGQITKQTDSLGNMTQMSYDGIGRLNQIIYPDQSRESIEYNEKNLPVKIINRDNTEISYRYDSRNNLVSRQDERGMFEAFNYDARDNLISHTDKNGQVSLYTYDTNDHLKAYTDPEGNQHNYSYDTIGRLKNYTSPVGNTITYNYSAAGDLVSMTDADGTIKFDYDENGNPTTITDRMGNRQYLEYDQMGQLSKETDFRGNAYRFAYDERGELVRETDPLGNAQNYDYDNLGNMVSWSDKNGNTTSYTYDAINQLTGIKDAEGNTTRYTYDQMGQVKTVTDPLGHQTALSYDVMGRPTKITDALGHSVAYAYDKSGNIIKQTEANGAVTNYSYDKNGQLESIETATGTVKLSYDKSSRLISIEDADGFSEQATYDKDGNLIASADKENNKTTFIYDKSGRIIKEIDAANNEIQYWYDKNGNISSIKDQEGNISYFSYDKDGNLTKSTDPLSYNTLYAYDAIGNLTTITDARGGVTEFSYDPNGNLIKETNPLGGEIAYSYDRNGNLASIKDENAYLQSFSYDAAGNLLTYTDANQNDWEYQYDAVGQLIRVTGTDDGMISMTYNEIGEITGITDQEGAKTTYQYDTLGRLTKMSDALGNSRDFAYDSLDRLISQTDEAGNDTKYAYSPAGNLLSITDPNGGTTTYTYNALGQVVSEKNQLGSVTTYTHDALGQVTSIKDPLGNTTSFKYTKTGEIASVTDARGGVTSYRYDAVGNLTQVTDPLGNRIAYGYDAVNNQIREHALTPDGTETSITIYNYDKKNQLIRELNPLSHEKKYTYDGNGNITKIVNEDGHETTVSYDLNNNPTTMRYGDGREALFRYNKRGELVELKDWTGTIALEYGTTGQLKKVTDPNDRVVAYSHDPVGNLTSITYPSGGKSDYAYDTMGRLISVSDPEDQVTSYNYDLAGNLLKVNQPNLSTTAYSYNAAGLPTTVSYRMADGTSMDEQIIYNKLGNILQVDRQGTSPELSRSRSYSYDANGQLLSYTEGQTRETYEYDHLGNMTYKRDNAQQTYYRYNKASALTAKTETPYYNMAGQTTYSYGYDKRGNLTEEKRTGKAIKQYNYDTANLMTLGSNLETKETTGYTYNALGMRVKNTQDSPNETKELSYVIDFLSDTNNDLLEIEAGYGTTLYTYGNASERLSQKLTPVADAPANPRTSIAENIGKTYFQNDLIGSILFVTNRSGEVLRYAERDAWGNLRIPQSNNINVAAIDKALQYTNHNYDAAIDKYFAKARFYDARNNRMVAVDPIKNGINPYLYCANDPINYIDPTGEVAWWIGAAGGGALFGLGEYVVSSLINKEEMSFKVAAKSAGKGAISGVAFGGLGKAVHAGAKIAKGSTKAVAGIGKATGNATPTINNFAALSSKTRDPRAVSRIQSQLNGNINYSKLHNYGPNGKFSATTLNNNLVSAARSNGTSGARFTGGTKISGAIGTNYNKALVSTKNPVRFELDLQFFASKRPVAKPTYGQGFSRHGYNPKQGERTLEAYEKYRTSLGRIKGTGTSSGKPLYRVMSEAELNAVKQTGKLRGGRPGETYFTDSYYRSAKNAQNRLSLPEKPSYIMEFRIKNYPNISGGAKVKPAYGSRGSGREYFTIDPIEIKIINYQRMRN